MKISIIKSLNYIRNRGDSRFQLFLFLISLLFTMSFQNISTIQKGWATYYGMKWHGRRTASGEQYHADSLTCAHKKFKFGTKLKVTHLASGKSVVVRVNDRGPNRKGRIIDLSFRAAKDLGMISAGVAWVQIEIVRP